MLYGRAFDTLGVSSPYYFSSAIIAATIFLGFGLDKYTRHEQSPAQPQAGAKQEAIVEEVREMAIEANASPKVEPE